MGGLARRFVQRLHGPPHELMDRDNYYVIPTRVDHFTLISFYPRWRPFTHYTSLFAVTMSTSTSINLHYPSEVTSIIENLPSLSVEIQM